MIRVSSLYETCHELFSDYPLVVRAEDPSETARSMVLSLQDGDHERFFILSSDRHEDRPCYSLRSWRAEGVVNIEADGSTISDAAVDAVTRGVPIPQDESLFGWRYGDDIVALVVFYTTYTPACPEPCWSVMPLADIPEAQWPPFTGERFFGHWFWEHYWAGNIVSVDGLVAGTPDTAFWVDTQAILGSDCCVVARDIKSSDGYRLRRGRYIYHKALREDRPVPSLEALLADPGKTDLAPRFR